MMPSRKPSRPAHSIKSSSPFAIDARALETAIGHEFHDESLLARALTHVSAVPAKGREGVRRDESYQRLEFLGDRVLGLAVSAMLYRTFPAADEGEMSRRLAELVRRESCAEVAAEWNIASFVRLGESEGQAGGATQIAILADVCEALVGAVFLDAGFEAAGGVVERAWGPHLLKPRRPLRDAKTALQEWAQGRGLAAPLYREVKRFGPPHEPQFTIAVQVGGYLDEEATGGSKRVAEQAAAAAFLKREKIWSGDNGLRGLS